MKYLRSLGMFVITLDKQSIKPARIDEYFMSHKQRRQCLGLLPIPHERLRAGPERKTDLDCRTKVL